MTDQPADFGTVRSWVSALATCAIEGNALAIEILDLWETDKQMALIRMRRLFEDE